jgi:hypothetical protein
MDITIHIPFSIGGSDYAPVAAVMITFSPSVNNFTFQLPLIMDSIIETSENLTAALSFPGGTAPPQVVIIPTSVQISILDDECEFFFNFLTQLQMYRS